MASGDKIGVVMQGDIARSFDGIIYKGNVFWYEGSLYEATDIIGLGGHPIPGTNCKRIVLGQRVVTDKALTQFALKTAVGDTIESVIEAEGKATRSYAAGDYFVITIVLAVGDPSGTGGRTESYRLLRATKSIAVGDTFTTSGADKNCEEITVCNVLGALETRVSSLEAAQNTERHYAKLHFGYAAPIGHIVLGGYGYATVAIQLPVPMEGTISSVTFSGNIASIGGIVLDTTQISQKYISGSTLFLVYAATSGTAWSTGILTTDVADGINLEITTT